MNTFEKWLITRTSDKKLISHIYKMLLAKDKHTYCAGRTRWEQELGRSLTHKEWEGIYYRARHSAYHSGLTEMLTKLATYWYYTPKRLHQYDTQQDPHCWRGCGEVGTLTHLLWECTHLRPYWQKIIDEVDTHLETQLPRFPDYIQLGLPNPLTYSLKSRRVD